MHPYRLQSSALPATPADLETFARLWRRSALLLPLALYLETDGADQLGERAALASALSRFLGRANALVFIDAREPWRGLPEGSYSVDVAKPSAAEQKAAWAAALGPDAGESPARLAGQFSLNIDTIREIAAEEGRAAPPGTVDHHDRLWDACLVRTRPRLDDAGAAHRAEGDLGRPRPAAEPRRHCCARSPTRSRSATASTRTGASRER